MIAVLVVRDGYLPAGGDETVAECDGRVLLATTSAADGDAVAATAAALDGLAGVATEVQVACLGDFEPGRWAAALAPVLADEDHLVLPASADGRDLAPRLAAVLRRPLYAGAIAVAPSRIELARSGGRELHDLVPTGPFVATLQPGVRGVVPSTTPADPSVATFERSRFGVTDHPDGRVVGELPADPASVDLGEAARIVAGGAGLDGPQRLDQVAAIGTAIGASTGATRVVTDRGRVSHTRQIGTTGVVVDPDLYLAFGISGAVQHTAGLGAPAHIVSVNTDAHCPMMQLADLAVVADANEVLDHLAALLRVSPSAIAPEGVAP
ncbi:MAG: mycofactocin-associated electron transfer flavoprotein alpha subunit [Ilumatobacteraceae bacterium]